MWLASEKELRRDCEDKAPLFSDALSYLTAPLRPPAWSKAAGFRAPKASG